MNILKQLKSIAKKRKNLFSIAVIVFLTLALPLFVWAILNQRFNIGKRASSGEPGVCVPINKVITVTPENSDGTCHNLQTAVNAVTGDGFTIEIEPGAYYIYSTVNVTGKSNLTIKGKRPEMGVHAVNFDSAPNGGWGILVENSSGSIEWLSISGGSSNGLLSIHNSSNFRVGYTYLNSQTSHTMDIQGSSNISVYNTEIASSAGGLEVQNSRNTDIANNKIHDSANAIAIYRTENVNLLGNLIVNNREHAVWFVNDVNGINMIHNSIYNNTLSFSYVYPVVEFGENITGQIALTQNIISNNRGMGIKVNNIQTPIVFMRNDVWNIGGNYMGVSDPTDTNGNISEDPRVNFAPDANYCLFSGSPAIFGDVNSDEYMGYIGQCSTQPTPSPTPSGRPTAGECQLCGGFAGIRCADGLTCQMSRQTHPDQSGICVKVDGTSSCSATPTPASTPSPTPSVPPHQVISFLIKFGGVTEASADGAKVKVYLQTMDNLLETPPIEAQYVANGIYKVTFTPSSPLASSYWNGQNNVAIRYPLYLKGEKHVRVRYCTVNNVLTRCSGAAPSTDGIYIEPQGGTYDLTAYSLEPGDLYVQDGIADYRDFRKIITLMAKPTESLTAADLLVGDLNYDGYINIRDAFLMRLTLSARSDDF